MKLLDTLCRNREFEQALASNRERLYRIAFAWCHRPELADDLVQDACAKALRQRKQLRDMKAVSPWLFRILLNTWHDHLRGQKDMVEFDEDACMDDMTPETVSSRFETVQQVRQAMARLPVGQREVVTLVDLERFSYAEVAAILDIPAGTVMSRLCRARRQLKDMLLAEDIERQGPVVSIRGVKR